jgi:Putative DNA-binding domain
MIQKHLDHIVATDIDALVLAGVPEGRTIEYKRELPGTTDADKKEFLADASSFANTVGGDLIYGVAETAGVPTHVSGIGISDLDTEQLRLESMLREGVDPRMQFRVHPVRMLDGKTVLVVRVDQSWEAPHRVVFKGHDRFYARGSAGKHSLDTGELRQAFMRTAAIEDSIAQFRDGRVIEIMGGRTPIALEGQGRMILHLIPLQAISQRKKYAVESLSNWRTELIPISRIGWDSRITLNGILSFSQKGTAGYSYAQLYRNGIVEAVDAYIVRRSDAGVCQLPSIAFEQKLLESTLGYLKLLKRLEIVAPVYGYISFTGVKGMSLGLGHSYYDSREVHPLVEDTIVLPEFVVTNFSDAIEKIMRSSIDLIWNAFGLEKSPNFDSEGAWKPR